MRELQANATDGRDHFDESRATDESAEEESDCSEREDEQQTSDEEETEENKVEPSEDIRGDIESALDELDFDGSYYYHEEFTSAPNPILHISGFGRLGLPLSKSDAVRLRSICTQVRSGKGDRTAVEKSVRGTWELNASEVQFENPAWKKWTRSIMKGVCNELGVDTSQSPVQVAKTVKTAQTCQYTWTGSDGLNGDPDVLSDHVKT